MYYVEISTTLRKEKTMKQLLILFLMCFSSVVLADVEVCVGETHTLICDNKITDDRVNTFGEDIEIPYTVTGEHAPLEPHYNPTAIVGIHEVGWRN